MSYSASYTSQFSYSSLSGLAQSLGFQASRQLSGKWSFHFVSSVGTSVAQQTLLAPTSLGSLISVPGTFEALSQAAAGGGLTGGEIASILTGAPVLSSPAQTLLYGSRFFFGSGQASVGYARSSRLRITASAGGSWTKHLSDPARDAAYPYVLPETKNMTALLSLTYSLTPRTQMSVSVSEIRLLSAFLNSNSTIGSVSLTRNMGRHWFLRGSVGVGSIQVRQATYTVPQGPQITAGGAIGYKLFGSTLMASYQRFMGDMYGLGAQSTLDLSGAWSWNRPGSNWGLNLSGGQQRIQFAPISTVNTWRAAASINRRLSPQLAFQIGYGFGKYSGYQGPLYSQTQSAVQAALVWTPHPPL